MQVETRPCFEALDEVLSVPGITCAFLGPADMGFSFGLHVQQEYDVPAMMASPDMQQIYGTVLEVRMQTDLGRDANRPGSCSFSRPYQ